MSTRPTRNWKIPDKMTVSKETAIELCRRPATLAILGCLSLAAVLMFWGLSSNSDAVSDSDLTDEQLESDFLALGALGVSDSASPQTTGVDTNFTFGDETEAAPATFNDDAGFLNRDTMVSATPEFEPETESDGPLFGRPIFDSSIRQTGFQEQDQDYSTASGARVTANQAVWLTGSIESPDTLN